MDMFHEIDKVKKNLPKLKSVSHEVNKMSLNVYQKIAVIIFIICLIIGVLFGNLFPACGSSSEFYADRCFSTEFNFSLMLFIWFISFIVCMLFYILGHIVSLLSSINEKISKSSKN